MGSQIHAGIDMGATLAKLVFRNASGDLRFELLPSRDRAAILRCVAAAAPAQIGLTGAGAESLRGSLANATAPLVEFQAWARGAHALLASAGTPIEERFLLVSLGTGTSVLSVDAGEVVRVGGTALGGGTLLGLAALLIPDCKFEGLTELARKGDRGRVDLRVADIYAGDSLPLPGELTASSFGKSGREGAPNAAGSDIAAGLMGLVGENVGLICAGIASAAGIRKIVFAGSTLRHNPILAEILEQVVGVVGCEPLFLRNGEYAGALGALLAADD